MDKTPLSEGRRVTSDEWTRRLAFCSALHGLGRPVRVARVIRLSRSLMRPLEICERYMRQNCCQSLKAGTSHTSHFALCNQAKLE